MFNKKNIIIAVCINIISLNIMYATDIQDLYFLEPIFSREEIITTKEHVLSWYTQDLLDSGCRTTYAEALEDAREEIFHATTCMNYYFVIKSANTQKIVGYIWCDQAPLDSEQINLGEVYIQAFFLEPEYRGKGIGASVIQQLEDRFRRKKVNSIGLYVFAHNEAAYNLYQKMGYEVTKILVHPDMKCIGFYMLKELNV